MIGLIRIKIKMYKFKKRWRKMNTHNRTVPGKEFPISSVKVGLGTYGVLNVETFGHNQEKLNIGNYVSIANNVSFVLGGNHPGRYISNYPYYSKMIELSPHLDALTKGPVNIEDEVWIGYGAIILSGLTIGKGSIIGAGSVVTKSTPPYSIFAGNPARFIRFRFDEEIIKGLLNLNLSGIDLQIIRSNIEEFHQPVTLELIERLKALEAKQ